jgi:hypothetical protein
MKKILFSSLLLALSTSFFGQYSRLGWTNDMQFHYDGMNYHDIQGSTKTKVIHFNNINFRFAGSMIGTLIFEKDTKFFIGEYFDVGFGVGMGEKFGGTYDGKTFNMLMGMNIGLVSCYNVSDDLTVGLKYIWAGGDLYYDLDEGATFYNGNVLYPTVRVGALQASVGFGGRDQKKPSDTKTKVFESELRFNLSDDVETGWYAGVRYRKSSLISTVPGADSRTRVGSFILMGGFYW